MAIAQLLLLASSAFAAELPQIDGTISGTVLNRSGDRARPCQATVMLLVLSDGQFVPFRETTADAQGKFRFDGLPVGDAYRYRAGANQDGVHFPGPRVSLTATRPSVALELTVYDASPRPCPLVIRQYEITLCPEPGMLRVTESMVVDNPSSTCYVGMAAEEDVGPVTLELAVPGDFERVTFQEEFYGRQFAMTAGKLATRIPWPPGRRELKFTYVLRSTESYRVWERPLDLPSSNVRVRVRSPKLHEVTCNLRSTPATEGEEVVFQSGGQILPAGQVIRIEMGHLPVPWTTHARWWAVGILVCLVAVAGAAVTFGRSQGVLPHRKVEKLPNGSGRFPKSTPGAGMATRSGAPFSSIVPGGGDHRKSFISK